jgi:predicted ATP-binding protein involved in virulence
MKLESVHIQDFRAIRSLRIPLDRSLTVFHGENGQGKTSVLNAIALGLRRIPELLGGTKAEDFDPQDVRLGELVAVVELQSTDNLTWSERLYSSMLTKGQRRGFENRNAITPGLRDQMKGLAERIGTDETVELPVIAYYDTERAVFWTPQRMRDFAQAFDRLDAYQDALNVKTSFKTLFEWFYAKESDELRQQRDREDRNHHLPELDAVRRAIEGMLPQLRDPHIETNPLRFTVKIEAPDGNHKRLALDQLSGGYRIMLALACDLARRMALANPHLENPLTSAAIVLIDEIELHLHPSWQQRVLTDLQHTFPNTQFIVSTHSAPVLTTVRPHQIVRLTVENDNVIAERETAPTFGNEAGDVLYTVMGVEERPPGQYADQLRQYRDLVALDRGETPEAMALRAAIQPQSADDPVWDALDTEIRRRRSMRDYVTSA